MLPFWHFILSFINYQLSLWCVNIYEVVASIFILQGIVGSDSSNKTAFVRRFVQGPDLMNCSSVRENSDCRVKCKLQVDGKWKLLLLREETGNPSKQVCYVVVAICLYYIHWVPTCPLTFCLQCCYCTQPLLIIFYLFVPIQLVLWADIILLVFSYADEQSLLVLGDCYRSIQDYRQENYDIPILMVGVQGKLMFAFC